MNIALQNYIDVMLNIRHSCLNVLNRSDVQTADDKDVTKNEWYAKNAKAEQILDSLILMYVILQDDFPRDAILLKEKLEKEFPMLKEGAFFNGAVDSLGQYISVM